MKVLYNKQIWSIKDEVDNFLTLVNEYGEIQGDVYKLDVLEITKENGEKILSELKESLSEKKALEAEYADILDELPQLEDILKQKDLLNKTITRQKNTIRAIHSELLSSQTILSLPKGLEWDLIEEYQYDIYTMRNYIWEHKPELFKLDDKDIQEFIDGLSEEDRNSLDITTKDKYHIIVKRNL